VFIIQVVGMADGRPCGGYTGMYLSSFDPDAFGGRGEIVLCGTQADARRFPDRTAAFECWVQRSAIEPNRLDGKANRPLTAYSIEVVKVTE
jgi:hypothetical protein